MSTSAGAQCKADYLKRYMSAGGGGDEASRRPKHKKAKKEGQRRRRLVVIDQDVDVAIGEAGAGSVRSTRRPRAVDGGSSSGGDDDDGPVLHLTKDLSTEVLKSAAKFKSDTWTSLPAGGGRGPGGDPTGGRRRHDSSHSDDSDGAAERQRPGDKRRATARHDSGSDLSPHRHGAQSDSDASPPRGGRKRPAASDQSDQSPARRGPAGRSESDSDLTPPRLDGAKRRAGGSDGDGDMSPPRARGGAATRAHARKPRSPERVSAAEAGGKSRDRTLDGKAAGLQSADALRRESEKLRKTQNEAFDRLDDAVSGRNAQTVVRDKQTGKRRHVAAEAEAEAEKQRKQAELKEKYDYWHRGVRQVKEHAERAREHSLVMAEPLARYEGDERLESHLKEQELKEDPMLDYMRKRKMKKHGITQVVPKYSGPAPAPNRFGIWPGYRWDGVDRGNGFEAKLLSARNVRRADEEESYKWFSGSYE